MKTRCSRSQIGIGDPGAGDLTFFMQAREAPPRYPALVRLPFSQLRHSEEIACLCKLASQTSRSFCGVLCSDIRLNELLQVLLVPVGEFEMASKGVPRRGGNPATSRSLRGGSPCIAFERRGTFLNHKRGELQFLSGQPSAARHEHGLLGSRDLKPTVLRMP